MILILGATGFIGAYLVSACAARKLDVVAVGRNTNASDFFAKRNVPFIQLDIIKEQDFKKLPTQNVEAVVLLAGLLPANVKEYSPLDYVRVNIEGTINVLEYCRLNNVKTILTTTTYADVKGSWKKDEPVPDEAPRGFDYTGDHAMYVISRNAAADIVEHYSQEYGIRGIVFRLPPVYGFGPHGVIYVDGKQYKSGIQTFIEKAIAGDSIEIWGDKNISRDVVYVKDVVKGIIQAIFCEKARGVYNMTSGQAVTLEEQAQDVIEIFSAPDRKSRIILRPEIKNITPSFVFDISRAKRDFDYQPEYLPFRKMMEDYKNEMNSGSYGYLSVRMQKD